MCLVLHAVWVLLHGQHDHDRKPHSFFPRILSAMTYANRIDQKGETMQKAVWHVPHMACVAFMTSCVIGCVGGGANAAAKTTETTAKEQTTEYDLSEPKMSCAEADKITRRALERLHYKITGDPKTPTDMGGEVKGTRLGFWGEEEPVSVKISCDPDGAYIAPRTEIPPCEQANRIMRKTVEDSGYEVSLFKPAPLGGAGMVKGKKEGQEPVAVTITCAVERNRVMVDTNSESPLLENRNFYQAFSDFQRGFYAMFKAVVDEFAYLQSPAHQNKVAKMNQVQIGVVPLIAADIKREFGDKAKEVTPVRITVFNSTTSAYLLEADKIVLLSNSGKRVKPMTESDQALPGPALSSQTVTPGAYVEGYLFYPPGAYTGARGSFVEQENKEREGFSIQF